MTTKLHPCRKVTVRTVVYESTLARLIKGKKIISTKISSVSLTEGEIEALRKRLNSALVKGKIVSISDPWEQERSDVSF